MTQINFVSRNQLHNTVNSGQHLNFGLSWPDYLGEKCKGKTLLVIEISFTLHRYCTVTAHWCSVSKAKHNQVFSFLAELAQKFKFL